jgi:hypothetical protein
MMNFSTRRYLENSNEDGFSKEHHVKSSAE